VGPFEMPGGSSARIEGWQEREFCTLQIRIEFGENVRLITGDGIWRQLCDLLGRTYFLKYL